MARYIGLDPHKDYVQVASGSSRSKREGISGSPTPLGAGSTSIAHEVERPLTLPSR